VIQYPPPSGAPYTPLPGATYGTFNLPAWPATANASLGLVAAGAALAFFGPSTTRYRAVAAGLAAWGGYRAWTIGTSWWPF
jgi:hypothetical protein